LVNVGCQVKKNIPYGEKLPVLFTQKEMGILHEYVLYSSPEPLNGKVSGNKIKVILSLDDIEDLMGYVAAEANHTNDKKLENALDKIFTRLNDYLSKYDDQE